MIEPWVHLPDYKLDPCFAIGTVLNRPADYRITHPIDRTANRTVTMKLLSICAVVASAVLSVLSDTIELGYPTDGTVLPINQNFTAQVILPVRYISHAFFRCLTQW